MIDATDPLFQAFRAGFDSSGEGYNGEYGYAPDEWLWLRYRNAIHGDPLPGRCGRISLNDQGGAPCARPEGHDGQHQDRYGRDFDRGRRP